MNAGTPRLSSFIIPAVLSSLLLAVWAVFNLEDQPIVIYGAIYAVAFWFAAWKWPATALILIFSIAPFQNDLGGGSVRFSLAEINIALLLPLVVLRCYLEKRPFHVGPTLIPVLLYFMVCAYTSIYHDVGRSTILSVVQMVIYLVFVVGIFVSYPRHVEEIRPALIGLLVVGCLLASYTVLTRNNFILGLNKNSVGQSYACTVLVALELWFAAPTLKVKKWIAVALTIAGVGLVFSVSRGAWMGCFLGAMLICGLRRQYQLVMRASLIMIPIFALAWQYLPDDTKSYATDFSAKRHNIAQRYVFVEEAKELWYKSPIIGSGVGVRKDYDATNLAWSTLAETGVLGLAAFLAVHIVFFAMIFKTHRYLRRDSIQFSLLLIGGALVLRHFAHGMVDHYWTRGAATLSWGGAGMAMYSYYVVHYEMRRRARKPKAAPIHGRHQPSPRGAFARHPQRRLPAPLAERVLPPEHSGLPAPQ
jgi:hypothetical protein